MFGNNILIKASIFCALFSLPFSYAFAADNSTTPKPTTAATQPTTAIKKKETKPTGLIVKVDGAVKILGTNKKAKVLKNKSVFFTHDTIVTQDKSHVALRFNDGTFVVLGPNSALKVTEFHFTPPTKGQKYQGSPKDHAELKLYSGVLKATMGSLVKANKPGAFKILTPRGNIEFTDPVKNPTAEVIYNNKTGLAVKALGTLNNSKGQVTLSEANYGLVNAATGSAPTLTTTVPLIFSEAWVAGTYSYYDSIYSTIDTAYRESILDEEQSLYQSEETSNTNTETQEDNNATAVEDSGDDNDGDSDDNGDNDSDSDNDDEGDDDSDDGDDDDDGGDDDGGDGGDDDGDEE
jgi:hypothetical protein